MRLTPTSPMFTGTASQTRQNKSHFSQPDSSHSAFPYSLVGDKASFSHRQQPNFSGAKHAESSEILHTAKEVNQANKTPSNIVYIWEKNTLQGIPFQVNDWHEQQARAIMASNETPSRKTSRLKNLLLKNSYHFAQKLERAANDRASQANAASPAQPEPEISPYPVVDGSGSGSKTIAFA